MRVAIVSDIHGNRHAFEAVLDAVADSPAAPSCGAWATSSATAPILTPASSSPARTRRSAWPATTISACAGAIPLEQFSRGAALAATLDAGDDLARRRRAYLDALEPQNLDQPVGLYHASPRDPIWEYVLSPLQAELCLDAQQAADRADRPLPRRAVVLALPGRAGHRRDP